MSTETRDLSELESVADLPGHAVLIARLEQALENAAGGRSEIALVAVNIDRFRVINHRFGHDAGDRFLVEVARRLQGCLRRQDALARCSDTVARIGADEFSVLLGGIARVGDALAVVERVRAALARPFAIDSEEISPSACFGIALPSRKGDRPEDLLRHSSIALNRAKEKGPDSHHVFEAGVDASEERRLRIENELREAAGRGQLELGWQPIVSLTTYAIVGIEAFLRWEHPLLGSVSPLEFLPVAEDSGLILPIGRWVMQEACSQGRHWLRRHPELDAFRISVNISGRELQHPEFHESVRQTLEDTRFEASRLDLEITEGLLMQPSLDLRRIENLGVRISIDDFGTGNLSFSYLARLPVSAVKIDGAVVSRLGQDEEASNIVGAMLATAKSFRLETIAESIETAEQLTILRGLGCTHGQGYYFTHPVPGEEIGPILEKGVLRPTPAPRGA